MQTKPDFPMLWRRCVQCPDQTPTCPGCPGGQTCIIQAQSCDACSSATCVQTDALPGARPKPKSSTPAIAGGVAGGVFFIIIVTFLVWWFCIRSKRQEFDQAWSETDRSIQGVEKRDQSGLNREARESTRSMGSIESSLPTGQNVIQIAYIPGVVNRSPTHSPGLMQSSVPPTPIPSTISEHDRRSGLPESSRDSTTADRELRTSLSPSLASTTLYPGSVELSARPAQQALRGKAAVVRVNKAGNNSPSDSGSPSNPSNSISTVGTPIVARHVIARPIEVKGNSGRKFQDGYQRNPDAVAANGKISGGASRAGDTIQEEEDDADADVDSRLISPTARPHYESGAETPFLDRTPGRKQSQFTDAGSSTASSVFELPTTARPPPLQLQVPLASRFSSSTQSTPTPHTGRKHQKSGSINSPIEEATSRTARAPSHGGLGSINEYYNHVASHPLSRAPPAGGYSQGRGDSPSRSGPFSDANELPEGGSRSGSASRTS